MALAYGDIPDPAPPTVTLPERLDRRLRLGPFPSARDALKFVLYAGIGALLVPWAGVIAWLPVLAVGLLVSIYRTEGKSLDEHLYDRARYEFRILSSAEPLGDPARARSRGGLIDLSSGRFVALVGTYGEPTAYLPGDRLEERFRAYRELLRSLEEGALLLVTVEPLSARAYQPSDPAGRARAPTARAGYDEMVRLLCRRRFRRRVLIACWSTERSVAGVTQLEGRVTDLLERLATLGLAAERLRGAALVEAAGRFGWVVEGE